MGMAVPVRAVAYWRTIAVGGKTSCRPDEASGPPDIETGDSTIRTFPFLPAASRSFCWMRRVSSFCRSAVTKVYSPVISTSLWPAILGAPSALGLRDEHHCRLRGHIPLADAPVSLHVQRPTFMDFDVPPGLQSRREIA
jgi:hypothetical protein